ncbi:PH domain-containing protein [Leucobacter sp. M11]|uniref:PH domain-containing protein n=1 Tax=Leucobacter sp. M11 TaxID=2993565 RepID=UPI002D7E2381|nr:PH domain-containing protein [Leucobacter sp. M11]MEB4613114.1 PH domain-containing protein [Leucobacter sp. M11]
MIPQAAPGAATETPESTESTQHAEPVEGTGWRRLSPRVIWVDAALSALAVLPAVIAVRCFGVAPTLTNLWPFLAVIGLGVVAGITDLIRWRFTRFRVTAQEVERQTGLIVRRHRRVPRDRIRSVDTSAKLRHRLAGLRVVTLGAGQQTTSGEEALALDALSRAEAVRLRALLLGERRADPGGVPVSRPAPVPDRTGAAPRPPTVTGEAEELVFARFRPAWVFYNCFTIWGYLMAAGLLWGSHWFASSFGVDLFSLILGGLRAERLGWIPTVLLILVGAGLLGALALAAHFLVTNWGFTLSRLGSGAQSTLRTSRGLLTKREVNRDEARTRGLSLTEPLLWRWIGMTDTHLITTGLSLNDPAQPAAILPRGPKRVAVAVAERVLGEPSPFEVPLPRHPNAALLRRIWWATGLTAGLLAALAAPVLSGALPVWALWIALGVWPLGLGAAALAYRALGHAISGRYLVVRSGLMNRSTVALQREAISTLAIRRSLLQRWLGLSSVTAMTAAGWFVYEATDVSHAEAFALAERAAPGLLAGHGAAHDRAGR